MADRKPGLKLTKDVARLQAQIDSLSVAGFQETLSKVSDQILSITDKVSEVLSDAAVVGALSRNDSPKPSGPEPSAQGQRDKIEKMSGEVIDSNPYSRLMALQRMGIVKDYEKIREKSIAIVGIGGVGSVAAEMLTRCGAGRLLLYDYDSVELANMNRLFFRPEHCGMTKTDAAAKTLCDINPDVKIESYTMNITTVEGFDKFKESLVDGQGNSTVDLVLSCVDNYEARMTINQVCLELKQIWMESGVSEDAVAGHIQLLMPGQTACYQCVPPLVVASGIDEKTLKREGVCAASLPTTMGIVAGLLVQNTLKYLLHFGAVSPFLGYNSLKDFFPQHAVMPNEECLNGTCEKLQQTFKGQEVFFGGEPPSNEPEEDVFHDDNQWGIEVMPTEADAGEPSKAQGQSALPEGVQFSLPASGGVDKKELKETAVDVKDENVDDLMAQLNALNS
ncbi:hypothetical protein BSKO_06604 [Bryopsis sp. KO-2023]|nr:hypothetical protein BSKO_06604 [Bryopsis sp. KO-2023]